MLVQSSGMLHIASHLCMGAGKGKGLNLCNLGELFWGKMWLPVKKKKKKKIFSQNGTFHTALAMIYIV